VRLEARSVESADQLAKALRGAAELSSMVDEEDPLRRARHLRRGRDPSASARTDAGASDMTWTVAEGAQGDNRRLVRFRSLSLASDRRLEVVVPALLGLAVCAAVLGSGSISRLLAAGEELRWVMLGLLFLAAIPYGFAHVRDVPRWFLGPLLALAAIALLSAAWSVRPVASLEHAATFAVLAPTVVLVAAGAVQSRRRLKLTAVGLLAAPVAVTLAGLALVAVDRGRAVQDTGERLRGLGQNPDTVALLLATAGPLAVATAVAATGRRRVAALGACAVIFGSLVASDARGSILAAVVGVIAYAGLRARTVRAVEVGRAALFVAVVVASVVFRDRLARPAGRSTAPVSSPSVHSQAPGASTVPSSPISSSSVHSSWWQVPFAPTVPASRVSVPFVSPGDEIGTRGYYVDKPVLHWGSGRVFAWISAVRVGLGRPILGFGFAMEQTAFRDRARFFQGDYTESSVVGMFLQLGVLGVALLVVPFAAVATAALRARRKLAGFDREAVACGLGMVVGAALAALFQSYLTSVGNVAALTAWSAAALAATVAGRGQRRSAVP
jgi:hypothetical protein